LIKKSKIIYVQSITKFNIIQNTKTGGIILKAVVKFKDGKNGWEIRDIPRSVPKEDEVEIKVEMLSVCGSELHLYHDNHYYKPPVVVGHEFSGVISRVGKNVNKWQVGERVVCENHTRSCRVCEFCRNGQEQFCSSRKAMGYDIDGYWTEYVCRPAWLLHKIPPDVSLEEAALIEPTSIVVHALFYKTNIKTNDIVLVQGCGPIGMIAAMVAKARGAKTVILTGIDVDKKVRIPLAKKLGIDNVINVTEINLKEKIMDLTSGKGVDVVIEASGSDIAINSAIDLVKKTGKIIAIGETRDEYIKFSWNKAIFRACTVFFSLGSNYSSWEISLNLIKDGKINLKKLITHKLPLEDWEKAFKLMDAKESGKVILIP